MSELISSPPVTVIEPVTEILHGVSISDPYRWLEDQNSPGTRLWIKEQTRYARGYLDNIPVRQKIRERIHEFLAVETYDSLQEVGKRYFFRKRLANQEQPCIYMREGPEGEDHVLVDPLQKGRDIHTAVKPLRVSHDGRFLLYEIKEGGERTASFAILDIESRRTLPDVLPRGYLRGFAFAPDCKSFYYIHETLSSKASLRGAVSSHVLGTDFSKDRQIFRAGEGGRIRIGLVSDKERVGFLVYKFGIDTRMDFFLQQFDEEETRECIVGDANYTFAPILTNGRLFAVTNRDAPNSRVVELRRRHDGSREWLDRIPETCGRIRQLLIAGDRILVSFLMEGRTKIRFFTLEGEHVGEIAVSGDETVRLLGASTDGDEVLLETESFSRPAVISRYRPKTGKRNFWADGNICFDPANLAHTEVHFRSDDGTDVPMFLVGRADVLVEGCHPAIMTSYGGFGMSMTPQFSVFAAFLAERGCLFALPAIRGGSEFGSAWHEAAKRRNRQKAYDDFLSAAEWLINSRRTTPDKLAIFGGSNSGLLVGAAMTQRPDLFRAVICMVPILDMLRFHLFDDAHVWRDEFGTAEEADDFAALRQYSPYHRVRDGVAYPATMIVSGDADQNCNPLHARKMTAKLQAANHSDHPILLHYSRFRGHSPVLPLSERVEALTDRMAFLCDQLELSI